MSLTDLADQADLSTSLFSLPFQLDYEEETLPWLLRDRLSTSPPLRLNPQVNSEVGLCRS